MTRPISRFGIAGVSLILIAQVAACTSSGGNSADIQKGSDGSYVITIPADLTGAVGALGSAFADGARAYFKSINYTAGGHHLTVREPIDTRSDAGAAQAAFRQAVEQRPIAMVGLTISSSVLGSQSILDAAGIPMINATTLPTLNGDGSTKAPKKWFFTIGAAGNQVVDGMVYKMGELVNGLKGRRIAIARSVSAAIEADAAVIKDRSKDQQYQVVADEKMTTGAASFASQAANIARARPEGVLVFGIGNDAVTMAKALAEAGLTRIPLLQFNGGTTFALMKAVDLPNYYATFDSPEPTADSALAAAASKLDLAQNVHNQNFAQGWSAAALVGRAITSCSDTCTPTKLTAELERVRNFTPPDDSTFGPIDLSLTDHVAGGAIRIFRWDPVHGAPSPAGDVVRLPAFSQ
ncbi:ABC transporter substrate-binding protein [Streptomyces sp. NPDC001276]|uniref:ABC transporter substrate-binding protein n=1 Tax=Streptomyces sp. NPDC001276 TaxID=3364555 RepID=UPI00367EBD58